MIYLGIIIGFIASGIVFAILWNMERKAWFFRKSRIFEYCIARFHFYDAQPDEWETANAWAKLVAEQLKQKPDKRIVPFIKAINMDPYVYSALEDAFKTVISRKPIKHVIEEVYGICRQRGFQGSAYYIKKSITEIIINSGLEDFRITEIEEINGAFMEEVAAPAIRETLAKYYNDIPKLEKMRQGCTTKMWPFIDEREIEILASEIDLNHPNQMFATYTYFGADSPAKEYFLDQFRVAAGKLEEGALGIWLNEAYNWYSPGKNHSPVKVILEIIVPKLDKEDIDIWLPKFADNPEFAEIFYSRIRELYADAPLEELAGKWNEYYTPDPHMSAQRGPSDIIDELMVDRITKLAEVKFGDALKIIPPGSGAWKFLTHSLGLDIKAGACCLCRIGLK